MIVCGGCTCDGTKTTALTRTSCVEWTLQKTAPSALPEVESLSTDPSLPESQWEPQQGDNGVGKRSGGFRGCQGGCRPEGV